MISERRNFHKVYDLTERVLPKGIDASVPTQQEHGRFLVFRYLKANGFGTLAEMTYLLKGVKAQVKCVLEQLLESGEIEKIIISDDEYFTCSESLFLLNTRLTRKHARILSPFDNMLIQRNRTSTIFNFDYQLECYVPAPKRKFGYFCLPILWDGKLVARADCKVNKPASKLELMHLYVEPSLKERDAFLAALAQELQAFAKFNQCGEYSIQKVSYDFY